jgi:hypothetical protein
MQTRRLFSLTASGPLESYFRGPEAFLFFCRINKAKPDRCPRLKLIRKLLIPNN